MTTQQTQHDLGNTALLAALRQHFQPSADDARHFDGLLDLIGRARFALLGEARPAPMSSTANGQKSPSA